MKTISKIYLLGLAIALVQGCGADRKSKQEESAKMDMIATEAPASIGSAEEKALLDSVAMPYVFSSASKVGKIDSIKKFIRTADIKFKVKNVEKSTYRIEDIVNHFDGFVTYTHLNCRVNYTESFRVKEDSLLQRMHYVVENAITFRVPKTLLDTTLKQIVSQIDFLDYRIIKAEDVSLAALKNKLSKSRYAKHETRVTEAIKANKTKDAVSAENSLLSKQQEADETLINDLELSDKVEYSTVQLYIYQDEKIKENTLFSQPITKSYKPSFGKEFVASLKFGWELVESIILLFVKIWPLILIGFGIYFMIKKLVNKKPKAQA